MENDSIKSQSKTRLESKFETLKNIKTIEPNHLCLYLRILRAILTSTPWYSTKCKNFFEVLNEIEIIKTKTKADIFEKEFSELTDVFGRYLTDTNCPRKVFSRIWKIFIRILPDNPDVKQTSIMDNVALFTELFDRIRNAGNIIVQVEMIQLLMLFISDTQLSEEQLTNIVGAPIFGNIRQRFTVNDIDTHGAREDIAIMLNSIKPKAERKVIFVLARRASFERIHLEIKPAQVNGVARDIMVYFNLDWQPSISFFLDISTIESENRDEICHNCEILQSNISQINITDESSAEGYFTMEVIFRKHFKMNVNNVASFAESVSFEFSNNVKPLLFQSRIFKTLKIVSYIRIRPPIEETDRPSVIQHSNSLDASIVITNKPNKKRKLDDTTESSAGTSAQQVLPMAEIQNIPVDYLISEHSDSPEKDEPPKKRFKSSTRQHMVKYVLTRSGEFVISKLGANNHKIRQKVYRKIFFF